MKNKNLLIGAALLGTAGVIYLSKVIKTKNKVITDTDIKAKQDAEANALKLEEERKKAYEQYTSLENKNSYKSKVSVVQQYLGVNPDGIVGQNTINALKSKFPQFPYISETNVDAIILAIDSLNKTTNSMTNANASLLSERKAYAKKLVSLTSDQSYYAVLLKDINAPVYIYDQKKGMYVFQNSYQKYRKGAKYNGNAKNWSDPYLLDRGNGEIFICVGQYRMATDPLNFQLAVN
jgi:hypothetical protein